MLDGSACLLHPHINQTVTEALVPGVPVVQAAEEGRTLSHDRRTRPGREDQPVLCVTGVAAEVAGAGDRGGDPGWKAAAGHNAARVDEGVSGGVGKVALASVRDSSSMQLPTQAPPVFRWPRPWCRVRCSGRSSQRLRRCAHNHHRPDVERRHRHLPRRLSAGELRPDAGWEGGNRVGAAKTSPVTC